MKSASQIGFVLGFAAVVSLAMSPVPASGDGFEGIYFGGAMVGSQTAQRFSDYPEVEAILPIPSFYDPSASQGVLVYCEAQLTNRDRGVRNAKGRFEVDLYLMDHDTGSFRTLRVGSGKIKGDADGYGVFDLSVPNDVLEAAFHSGNVSAWLRSHGRFSGKKGDAVSHFCGLFVQG